MEDTDGREAIGRSQWEHNLSHLPQKKEEGLRGIGLCTCKKEGIDRQGSKNCTAKTRHSIKRSILSCAKLLHHLIQSQALGSRHSPDIEHFFSTLGNPRTAGCSPL
eukprot:1160704-Pelagomonas_calceolata.AAC.7